MGCICSCALDLSPSMLDAVEMTLYSWLPLLWASTFLLLLAAWIAQRCWHRLSGKRHQVGGRLLGSPSQGDWPADQLLLCWKFPCLGGTGAGQDPHVPRVGSQPRSLMQCCCTFRSPPADKGARGRKRPRTQVRPCSSPVLAPAEDSVPSWLSLWPSAAKLLSHPHVHKRCACPRVCSRRQLKPGLWGSPSASLP